MSDPVHDLAVVGGGLIGAAAALGAARAGRRVLLLERARPTAAVGRLGIDIRNVSLSPASRTVLERLGVWPAAFAAPFVGMRVWEEQGTQTLVVDAAEVGRSELGWIVENGPLVESCWRALEAAPGVDVELVGGLSGIEVKADRVELETSSGIRAARLLVGVDGARSTVRELTGVESKRLPTGHHALVTVLRTEQPHRGVALQRFLLDGPLALLPSRQPDLVSVVWSQPAEAARRRVGLDDEAFCREAGFATEHVLGEVLAADQRTSFPLVQHLVRRFDPAPRVLLLGDAARVIHPLAGLGANVGFEDVRDFLARLESIPQSADPGAAGIWQRFARQRRARSLLMLSAMTALKQVYAEDDPYLQWLRNVGVSLTSRIRPLKRQVIREALGLGPLASSW